MECAGNGRAFFNPPVAGVQWERGAVGTAAWTGVRLADLLSRAGIKPSARYVWFDGADRGVGRAPDFIRSVPIEKALDRDTMLAYEMNGDPADSTWVPAAGCGAGLGGRLLRQMADAYPGERRRTMTAHSCRPRIAILAGRSCRAVPCPPRTCCRSGTCL